MLLVLGWLSVTDVLRLDTARERSGVSSPVLRRFVLCPPAPPALEPPH
jgi:hypothetical protein